MRRALLLTILTLAAAPLNAQSWAVEHLSILDGAYLGVMLEEVDSEDVAELGLGREAGARIQEVVSDSPAERAGLLAGDVIVGYSGFPVLSVRQLQRLVRETPVGRRVDLDLVRDGRRLSLTVELGEARSRSPRMRVEPRLPRPDEEYSFRLERPDVDPQIFFLRDRARLGISGVALTEQLAEALGVEGGQGVFVTEVTADSPAQRAGLRAGDAIVSVDGEKVSRPAELSARLRRGQTHELTIVRDGVSRTVQAEIPGGDSRIGSGSVRM